MTALKGKAITAFLNQPDPQFKAILVYGPDQGLVSERVEQIAKSITPDLNDPFNAIELSEPDLKAEPGRLVDEICALSFMGGERVIRLRTTGEKLPLGLEILLSALAEKHIKPNGYVLISAGDLGPRSGLRKAFEKARHAAALPCYLDGAQGVRQLAISMAREHGVQFEDEALALLCAVLGENRAISRSEIEKILFFVSPGNEHSDMATTDRIGISEVQDCLVDRNSDATDRVAASVLDGTMPSLATALFQCTNAGTNPITLLLSLQRNVARLRDARRLVDQGKTAQDAMKSLRPPVFFGEQDAFRNRLNRWTTEKLGRARRALVQAELDAKTTGLPQREIVERLAFQLCAMAKR